MDPAISSGDVTQIALSLERFSAAAFRIARFSSVGGARRYYEAKTDFDQFMRMVETPGTPPTDDPDSWPRPSTTT